MSYGLPCPDSPEPSQVFTAVDQFDTTMSSVVQGVIDGITSAKNESSGLIGTALQTLTTWLQKQLQALTKLISEVWDVLRSQITSQQFVINSTLMTTISDIATQLGQTTEQVMYGPAYPQQLSQQYPSQGVPYGQPVAVPPVASSQPFPPGTQPAGSVAPLPFPSVPPPGTGEGGQQVQPPSAIPEQLIAPQTPGPATAVTSLSPSPIPASSSLVLNGQQTPVTPVCQAFALANAVGVNGFQYQPTAAVYMAPTGMATNPDGSPRLTVGYDVQPDGSVVVNVGPVAVHVSLPSANPGDNAPQCDLVPV